MKQYRLLFLILTAFLWLFPTPIFGSSDLEVKVGVVDEFGVVYQTPTNHAYGGVLNVELDDVMYWSINGFLRTDLESPITIKITSNTEILTYQKSDKPLILYVDTNFKIVKYEYLNMGDALTPPTNLSKPLSNFIGWGTYDAYDVLLDTLPKASDSIILVAKYELIDITPPILTLEDATSELDQYQLNDIVKVSAKEAKDGLAFSYFVNELNEIVSLDNEYMFTLFKDTTIKAVYGKDKPNQPLITLTGPLYIREDYQSYVGQFSVCDNQEVLEFGFEFYDGTYVKAKSHTYNPLTNEFLMSFDEGKQQFRSYLVVLENGIIKRYYNQSDQQLNAIIEAIKVPETVMYTTEVLDLKETSLYQSVITWQSSNQTLITNEGVITMPEIETEVSLTATIQIDDTIYTKVFNTTLIPPEQPKWYIEDFANTNLTATYSNGFFIGPYQTEIKYGHARDEGDYPIEGKGVLLRRASDSYLEFTVSNGLKNLSFDYRKGFTATGVQRQLEIIINGVQVMESAPFGDKAGEETKIYNIAISNTLIYEGYVTVKIKNIGTSADNRHIVIDNLKWESNPTGSSQTRIYQINPNQKYVNLFVGETFDPSFKVVDQYGTFIADGMSSDSVDTTTAGTYLVHYSYNDADGAVSLDVLYNVIETTGEDRGFNNMANIDLNLYYRDITGQKGEALKLALRQTVQRDMHPVKYGDARYILSLSDRNPDNPNFLIGMYDSKALSNTWDNTWDREHVWPNSKLGIPRVGNSESNIGSDLHNLRAILSATNSSRGNKYFDHYTTTTSYYPRDEHKGDVARILFYMIVMYPELNLTDVFEDLISNSETNYTPAGAFMGKKSVLLQWHEEDPVDAFEMERNNFIYNGIAYTPTGTLITPQGNRNPFIDRSYYAEWMFIEDIEETPPLEPFIYAPFTKAFYN